MGKDKEYIQPMGIDNFRINHDLIVESDNLLKKLAIKLTDKFSLTLSPNSKKAVIASARQLCKQADNLLASNHDISTYQKVVELLSKACDVLVDIKNETELFSICTDDLTIASTHLKQRMREQAKLFVSYADDLSKHKDWQSAINNYYVAIDNYTKIGEMEKVEELKSKIYKCECMIHFEKAQELYLLAEEYMLHENYDKAINCISKAKDYYSWSNKKEYIPNCEKLMDKCVKDKKEMIDRCNKEATKHYNIAHVALNEKDYDGAIDLLKQAKAKFLKAGNSKSVSDCELKISICQDLQTANDLYLKSIKLIKQENYVEALKNLKKAKKIYTDNDFNTDSSNCAKLIEQCNDSIKQCEIKAYELYKKAQKHFLQNEIASAVNYVKEAKTYYQKIDLSGKIDECNSLLNNCARATTANNLVSDAKLEIKNENYLDALSLINQAKQIYQNIGLSDVANDLTALTNNVELAKRACIEKANKFYNTAITEYNHNNYINAIDWLKYAYTLYKQVGDNQSLEKCSNFINACNCLIDATELFDSAKDDYNNRQYNSAIEKLNKAKYTFSNYKSDKLKETEELISKCNKKINHNFACEQYNKGLKYAEDRGYNYYSNLESAIELFETAEKYFNYAGSERDAEDCRKRIKECKDEIDYIEEQERKEQEEREREEEERENYRIGEDKFNYGVSYYRQGDYSMAKFYFEEAESYGYDEDSCRQYIDDCNEDENEQDDDDDIYLDDDIDPSDD